MMFKAIKEFFFGKAHSDKHPLDGPTRAAQEKVAPYKVETPVADTADIALAQMPAPTPAITAKKKPAPKAKAQSAKPAKPSKPAPAKKPTAPKKSAPAKKK
jgi:hypothetical protein